MKQAARLSPEQAFEEADARENLINQEYLAELRSIHRESLQVWDKNFEELTGKTPHWGTVQLGPERRIFSSLQNAGQMHPAFAAGMLNAQRSVDFQRMLYEQQHNIYGGLAGLSQHRQIGLSQQQIKYLDLLTGREDS